MYLLKPNSKSSGLALRSRCLCSRVVSGDAPLDGASGQTVQTESTC